MPRKTDVQDLVEQFVDRLSSLIEAGHGVARARRRADRVRRPRAGRTAAARRRHRRRGARKRRKGPIQLCPVPGCSNRAAPVFGMVCSKHKDLPKSDIKKYREQRRAQKAKAKAKKAA